MDISYAHAPLINQGGDTTFHRLSPRTFRQSAFLLSIQALAAFKAAASASSQVEYEPAITPFIATSSLRSPEIWYEPRQVWSDGWRWQSIRTRWPECSKLRVKSNTGSLGVHSGFGVMTALGPLGFLRSPHASQRLTRPEERRLDHLDYIDHLERTTAERAPQC